MKNFFYLFLFSVLNTSTTVYALDKSCRKQWTADLPTIPIATLTKKIKANDTKCQNANQTVCENTVTVDGRKYLYKRYPKGNYKDQLISAQTFNGYEGMMIEGDSAATTTLEYSDKFNGGLAIFNHNPTSKTPSVLIISNLKIQGNYNGWANVNDKQPKDANETARFQWQKAFYALGAGSVGYVKNTSIQGFYYGVTAEEGGSILVENSDISYAGDGGFFAYYGGKIYVCDSSSSYAADKQNGLGFGFVAESLHYSRNDQTSLAQCKGNAPEAPDRWDDPSFISCIIQASKKLLNKDPSITHLLPKPSSIFIGHSVASNNLMGGFMANMGAKLTVNYSIARSQYSQYAMSVEPRTGPDNNRANSYTNGQFGAGHGFISRLGSSITAKNTLSYNNVVGYNSYYGGDLNAENSKAWNNAWFGYHSVNQSVLDASNTVTFGASQKFGYAVDQDSLLIKSSPSTLNMEDKNFVCSDFLPNCPNKTPITKQPNDSTPTE